MVQIEESIFVDDGTERAKVPSPLKVLSFLPCPALKPATPLQHFFGFSNVATEAFKLRKFPGKPVKPFVERLAGPILAFIYAPHYYLPPKNKFLSR
jgi:hypothetical protein